MCWFGGEGGGYIKNMLWVLIRSTSVINNMDGVDKQKSTLSPVQNTQIQICLNLNMFDVLCIISLKLFFVKKKLSADIF